MHGSGHLTLAIITISFFPFNSTSLFISHLFWSQVFVTLRKNPISLYIKYKYFLGIEVAWSKSGFFISQRKYIHDLLKETWKLGAKLVDTPIEQNHSLHLESGEPLEEKRKYQRLVGRLIYLIITMDIPYVVSFVRQFMHAPRTNHLTAVHMILRYLKGSPGR